MNYAQKAQWIARTITNLRTTVAQLQGELEVLRGHPKNLQDSQSRRESSQQSHDAADDALRLDALPTVFSESMSVEENLEGLYQLAIEK